MATEVPIPVDCATQIYATDRRIATLVGRTRLALIGTELAEKNIAEVVAFANAAQQEAKRILHLSETASTRIVDEVVAGFMLEFSEGDGVALWLRHGKQQAQAGHSKIDMMRLPDNMEDPMTDESLAEAVGTGIILRYISEKTGKPIEVKTSENKRAMQAAGIIAAIANARVSIDQRLTCVNYDNRLSDEEVNQRLGPENNGSIVWEEEIVDSVCGEGTWARISSGTIEMLNGSQLGRGTEKITVFLTHTQQTNVLDNAFGDNPTRLAEFGFRATRRPSGASLKSVTALLHDGFYKS